MKKLAIACLVASSLFAHSPKLIKNTNNHQKLTLNTGINYAKVMKYLQNNGHDVMGVDFKNKLIDIYVNPLSLKEISHLYKIEGRQKISKARVDERYLNPEEVKDILKSTHQKYPNITKLINVGESLEGQEIWAIKISDQPQTDDPSEPNILFNGMHHAREVMTAEVTTDIVTYLTSQYSKSEQVRNWVDANEIYILPMLNVDGNTKVWEGQNMWRKNTRGGYGVDLNRNYPTDWNKCGGSSGWRTSSQYRGSEPASEPETNVLMKFVSDIKPVFNISYHAYSELVIYPKGCKGERTENRAVVEGIGKEMAQALDYSPGTGWELLYSVDGSDIDWMWAEQQVIPYVIEVSPRSDGFQPNYAKRDPTVKRNRKGWQYLLNRLNGAGLHGVTDKYTRIEYTRKEDNKEFSYNINPDGSYHIITTPGQYDITFIGEGQNYTTSIDISKKITVKH